MIKATQGKHIIEQAKSTSPLNAARKAAEGEGKSYTYLSRHKVNPDSAAQG